MFEKRIEKHEEPEAGQSFTADAICRKNFAQIFANMARHYFNLKTARQASRAFYHELTGAIEKHTNTVEGVVKKAMQQCISIWQDVKPDGQ